MSTPPCILPTRRLAPGILLTFVLSLPLFSGAAPARGAAPSANAPAETVELSVFEVTATKDTSYSALNTNSVTRFVVELDKLPITADVFTASFIADVGATDIDALFVRYGTSGGMGGANPASGAEMALPGDSTNNPTTKLRGLDSGGNRRNGFLQTTVNDVFSVDRVEVIRGPQALLYGGGGAGGVVNSISRPAQLRWLPLYPASSPLLFRL